MAFLDFQDKWIVVTGASSGIGRAISIELSRNQAKLILIGRDHDRLTETAMSLSSSSYHILRLDLNELTIINERVMELTRGIGRLYGLCHAAGVVETRPLNTVKIDGFQKMLDLNLISGIELARTITHRNVMEQGGGSILFISSVYGRVGMPGQICYSATKGAISAAVRSMAVELARRKIRVNSLSPGLVRTPMTSAAMALLSAQQVRDIEEAHPLGTGTPEDVARAAAFLLAPQSAWITGTELVIDGGYTAK
jgi:NAD(P)-dependent dehydrogenase (short-subunit alcohol dehydrogenase family)